MPQPPSRQSVRRRIATVVALGAVSIFAVIAVFFTPGANAATTGCSVTYTVQNQWPGGFTSAVTVKNLGTAINGWTLAFDFPAAGQLVGQNWSATWTQSGQHVTATSLSWNAALAPGASTGIGFNGTWTTSNPVPASFTLNGVACTGSTTTSPSPTLSPSHSPSASPSPSHSPSPSPSSSPSTSPSRPPGTAPALHVSGNKLLDSNGATVRLLGVNRSGGEFACVQGNGIWDGPMDDASVAAIASWKVNAVRVPLNEDCWLGLSNVQPQFAGTTYQQAVEAYVALLHSHGMVAILDLHWTDGVYTGNSSACSSATATCQKPMPDAAHANAFWSSVATTFRNDPSTVFDLFNEPYAERATGSEDSGWACWLSGGTCAGIGYQVAGMQSLVNSVRSAGATNVIMLGGLAYSNDLTGWLAHEPSDPDHNLVASWHSYNFNTCSNSSCWDSQVAPVASSVPLVAGELGENDCGASYVSSLMSWLDSHGASFLAWTWNAWDCSSGPSLISDYTGTATAYGAGVKSHLAGE
jgi:endoglucanase